MIEPSKAISSTIDWKLIGDLISSASDLFTIAASSLAIYLFVAKRKEVSYLFRALGNAANQSSISDLRSKLDKLNDLNASDTGQRNEVINICHEICGQIDGNPNFTKSFSAISAKIRSAASNNRKPIGEPHKRALVSELREAIRHFDTLIYIETFKEPKQ